MNFYKGYIQTRNKKALKQFKDGKNLVVLDWARKFDEYAGVLNDGVALYDFDERESSNIVLRICDGEGLSPLVIGATRGDHFLFADDQLTTNKTHCTTAIGLTVDIKLGSRNSY